MRRLLPALLLPACSSISSSEVLTADIEAAFTAESDGQDVHATATLRIAGSEETTWINLEDGDRLVVQAGEAEVEMSESFVGELYIYDADLSGVPAGTELIFRRERERARDALDSRCSLPEPLVLSAPEPVQTYSRQIDDIPVAWAPSGLEDPVRVVVNGDCLWDEVRELQGDPGEALIEAGSLVSLDEEDPRTCPARLYLQRRRVGSLDPELHADGTVLCQQVDATQFTSEP